ncbi:MAG: PIN domain-containing protein [Sandaracinaceae bacterium]|nr:PIN domain-containing protein [Sandaracinaceae bacterium]
MIHGLDTSFLVQVEIAQHPGHETARGQLDERLDRGDSFALAPQVLAELIHVVTDPRRFERPLSQAQARRRAEAWWQASEVVQTLPNEHTVPQFLAWLTEHDLGRKRLLDTLLAATYATNEIDSILTGNARDFAVFGCFTLVGG